MKKNLPLRDNMLEGDDLTSEDWAEIKRREKMIETGEAGFITFDEFKRRLNELGKQQK